MVSILLALATAPLLFFLPGYLASLFLPRVRGVAGRVAISVSTSAAFGVLISYGAGVAALPVGPSLLAGLLIICAGFGWAARARIFTLAFEWRAEEKSRKIAVIGALLLSLVAGSFVMLPHRGYPWPIHADEWWQVGVVQNLVEGKSLDTHPYFWNEFPNHKPGFGAYLAGVFDLWGIDPVRAWAYLPGVNFFLVALVAGLLVYGMSGHAAAGLAVPVLLAAIRSNAYMLGWWFFVPSTFAALFVLPLFITATAWLRSARGIAWGLVTFGALALVYAPFAAVVALALLPMVLMRANEDRSRRALWFSLIGAAAVVGVAIALAWSPYAAYWMDSAAPQFLKALAVPVAATAHFAGSANPLIVVVLPLALLALIGAWHVRREWWAAPLGWAGALAAVNAAVVATLGFAFLVFHQRALFFLGLTAALLGAVGVGVLAQRARAWPWGVKGIAVAAAMTFLFIGYFRVPSGMRPYQLVNEEDLRAIEWLAAQPDLKNEAVLAPAPIGTIVTPLARLRSKVTFLTSQSAGAQADPGALTVERKSCLEREAVIVSQGAGVLYQKMPQECDFLREIYRSERTFIYRYEPR